MSRTPTAPTYLTLDEAAAIARAHRATIVRAIEEGRLAAGRLGDGPRARYRIHKDELDRFMRGEETVR